MKSHKNILGAFLLNMLFSIIELIGGILTNSIAIISDAIHDFGDALSIGISYFLEKKSNKKPDHKYTYGYARYSILGALITTCILIVGSLLVIIGAFKRLINPVAINYDGMILLALIGTIINYAAVHLTKNGVSLNQKAVNLHMIEDVLGWLAVLIGSIIMKFTNISIIDSIMSVGVSIFILIHSFKNLKSIIDLFLEKIPSSISIENVMKKIKAIDGVIDVHHIHIWSIDGINNYATMHVVTNKNDYKIIKQLVREELKLIEINHATIEIETKDEICSDIECSGKIKNEIHHHHH